MHAHKQIAAAAAAVRNSALVNADDIAVGNSRRDFNNRLSVHGMNLEFAAKKRICELYTENHQNIIAVSREPFLGLHVKFDIQISRTAALSRFAAAGHAHHLSIRYSCRNRKTNFFLLFGNSLSPAGVARVLRCFSAAHAAWACARACEVAEE